MYLEHLSARVLIGFQKSDRSERLTTTIHTQIEVILKLESLSNVLSFAVPQRTCGFLRFLLLSVLSKGAVVRHVKGDLVWSLCVVFIARSG